MSPAAPDPAALAVIRRAYARQILLRAGALGNGPLEDAFAAVAREDFLGPGPWRTAWRGACPFSCLLPRVGEAPAEFQPASFACMAPTAAFRAGRSSTMIAHSRSASTA